MFFQTKGAAPGAAVALRSPRGSHQPPQDAAREVTGFPLKAAQHAEPCWWDGSHPPWTSRQPQNHRALLIPHLLPTM